MAHLVSKHPEPPWPPLRIFDVDPADWRDLQSKVAQALSEMGFEAATDHPVQTARGKVNLDVVARDGQYEPVLLLICECKLWSRRVNQNVIHAFRAVASDTGAHIAIIISKQGFQAGATPATKFTNLRLYSWDEFQKAFFERWVRRMATTTFEQAKRLHEAMAQACAFSAKLSQERHPELFRWDRHWERWREIHWHDYMLIDESHALTQNQSPQSIPMALRHRQAKRLPETIIEDKILFSSAREVFSFLQDHIARASAEWLQVLDSHTEHLRDLG